MRSWKYKPTVNSLHWGEGHIESQILILNMHLTKEWSWSRAIWNLFMPASVVGKLALFQHLLNMDLLISAQMQPSAGLKYKLGETAITCCCIIATEVSLTFMFPYITETNTLHGGGEELQRFWFVAHIICVCVWIYHLSKTHQIVGNSIHYFFFLRPN